MTTKNSETLLRELLDREAIRELPDRYCHCVWTNDVDGIVDLFTEDGSMTTSDPNLPGGTQGRENLRAGYKLALGDLAPRPFVHSHVIDLQGADRATGTCYLELRATREGKSWIGAGWYDDEYARVGESWKFRSRKLTMHYMVPLSQGWAEQKTGENA